ncbi:uncharacterized protein N7511_011351 [Penicillium nucicola]|uniref:uncharacterized protein n=1 Tax=Penicillium nucicola TaxID=1850975 RepID=UPI0025451D3E|nr:uncharacterized protein N7511_011351 [Penicillium nucicola]KAJ5742619.1 hypothetical protein N7511_011351 [Penicillium nucicola]
MKCHGGVDESWYSATASSMKTRKSASKTNVTDTLEARLRDHGLREQQASIRVDVAFFKYDAYERFKYYGARSE